MPGMDEMTGSQAARSRLTVERLLELGDAPER